MKVVEAPPSPPMLLGQGYQTDELPIVTPPTHQLHPSHLTHSDSFYAGPVLQRTPPSYRHQNNQHIDCGPLNERRRKNSMTRVAVARYF